MTKSFNKPTCKLHPHSISGYVNHTHLYGIPAFHIVGGLPIEMTISQNQSRPDIQKENSKFMLQ